MNSNIQQRLFNYSEAPPRSAWEGIAAALEEKQAYAQKLYQFEAEPPALAWEKVAAQLPAAHTKVVSFRTKLFKYAIAAAILGVIATGAIFYLKQGAGADLARQPQSAVSSDTNESTLSDTQPQSDLNTAANKSDMESNQSMTVGMTDRAMVEFAPRVNVIKKGAVARTINITPAVKNVIDMELSDRYMIATTAAGKAVRLPKKAYSDYACADRMNNGYCKERLASIQNKMAASVATDFTDFVDLLKKLQESQ